MLNVAYLPPQFPRTFWGLREVANLYFVESSMKQIKNWVVTTEVEALRKAARKTRHPTRNELMILMLYRHGLRVSELCQLQLEQVNLDQATLFVKRSKAGIDGMHPIAGDELRLLRRYLRERDSELPWLFLSERRTPLVRSSVNKLLEACGQEAGLPHINPHMLRHGCGFYMINNGYDIRAVQIYLGHASITNTAIYTRYNEKQFIGMWER